MDSAGVILPPIRACAPETVHSQESTEARVRQAAEGLFTWPIREIGELEPRIGAEWGGPLTLVGLIGRARGSLRVGCR